MLHAILCHLGAHWKIQLGVPSVFVALGLFLHEVTRPAVVAVMVFLSDWNMLWTWEWWTRMIIFVALGTAAWFYQKRKCDRKLSESDSAWREQVVSLQGEIRHSELMLAASRTELAILRKPGRK